MSHLIEEYAKSLGVKIGKPFLSRHFFPINSKRYITFHTNDKKSPARHYDHWDMVFDLIKPILSKNKIDIIQVGGPEDKPNKYSDKKFLGCTFKQMSYIISHSEMHLGIDSVPIHIASTFDIPIVGVYSNLFPECSKPVWNSKSETIQICPDFSKQKPSFSDNEPNKRVNEINPEEIAVAVLNILGIEHDYNSYQTLHIGKHYLNQITEIVPDFNPALIDLKDKVLNLRCDYGLDENFLDAWLNNRVNLMTDKEIPVDVVEKNINNILAMTFFVDTDNTSTKYFEKLDKLNLSYTLITKNYKDINHIRMKFFDYTVEKYRSFDKKDLDFVSDLCDNTYYHSNKTLISKNKKYYSKAAWMNDIEQTEDHQKLIDSDHFWEEIEHMNIYNYDR